MFLFCFFTTLIFALQEIPKHYLLNKFALTGKDAKVRGLAAPSNLSMNQTLEGHTGKFYTTCFSFFCLKAEQAIPRLKVFQVSHYYFFKSLICLLK